MKNKGDRRILLLFPVLSALLILIPARANSGEIKWEVMSSGAMPLIGGYMPQRVELSDSKPEGVKKAPSDITAPHYGEIKMGPSEAPTKFLVVVDEPEGKPFRLFVDANGNGDLTDDAAAEWKSRTSKGPDGNDYTSYSGGANLRVAYGKETVELHVPIYRFDKKDPQRAALKNNLFYYSDYARKGDVALGGKSYKALLTDGLATGDFRGKKESDRPAVHLLIDVNDDGKFDMRREAYDINKPFNIGGTTYEINGLTASGGSFQIAKSDKTVEEIKPAMNLGVGQKALGFQMKTTDGKTVNFPESYKGKLVMLDFWATWCGPCREELPNLTAAYQKLHDKGFEVLGVSLDQAKAEEKLATFTKENKMPWPQIYDGKYWDAAIAKKYEVDSIPRAFLVDGDTGMILATGDDLRGTVLKSTLDKALATKNKN